MASAFHLNVAIELKIAHTRTSRRVMCKRFLKVVWVTRPGAYIVIVEAYQCLNCYVT